MEYTVVTGDNLDQLITRVNNFLEFGFIPAGGVSRGDNGIFYQAMIREYKKETKSLYLVK